MVLMTEERIGDIPAIHAAPKARFDAPLPTIFLFHGYTSSKELNSYLGYMLAQAGFRVILPEADLHGARFDGNEAYRLTRFWDILRRNIDELPLYREHYASRGLIEGGRIGVAGTSMGGFTALGCMARYPWVKTVANYMGSGYYLDLSRTLYPPLGVCHAQNEAEHARCMLPLTEYDVSMQLDKLAGRPLLVWHGMRDEIVPFGESERLRADLTSRGLTGNLTYMADPNATHKLPMSAAAAGVAFFTRHL
ncbi:esterase [Polaromonas sp. P1(28)-13]|nr:esterase [Polaromonas sp. P1(28)-13]